MSKALLFLGLALPLMACAALTAPFAAPKGMGIQSTSENVQPTFSPSPSRTPRPTRTPTVTPTATFVLSPTITPTIRFVTPPPVPTLASSLSCQLIWQSPGNNIVYEPDESFTVGWKVRNNGFETWLPGSVIFTYLRGAKLYDYSVVQLETSVAPGQEVILSVHMRAPEVETKYTTTWGLREGDTFFCPVRLSIYVVKP